MADARGLRRTGRTWLALAAAVTLAAATAGQALASPLLPQALALLASDIGARDAEGNPRPGCPVLPTALGDDEYERLLANSPSRGVLLRLTDVDHREDTDEEAVPRESYLYALPPAALRDWLVPGPEVRAAVAAVDRVVLELDLSDATVFDSLQAMARQPLPGPSGRAGRLPALPDELEAALQGALDAACLAPPPTWRPELRALSLLAGQMRAEGHDPGHAIAGSIADLAESLGKPLSALETPERQLAPLLGDGPGEVAERVRQALDAVARPETLATLRRAEDGWDSAVLSELNLFERRCNCRQTALERRLWTDLEARNSALAEQIAALHRRGTRVFAALGALQLSGQAGVAALLEGQGFQVEWVAYPRRPPSSP
ncbi:TraB/GumN family protein [Leptothrix discophora]|uniref:TraB/GumN family protein n=1 Tax=Leptothrix discophora TaxID=89 RepID=A0ABT9G8B2_LEPDI|nr:TraB/GumN family protein [Leptothrix discophora]MDP4302701.1 TraB/GumN family protein [Leptothrix discophora]